MRNGCSEPSSAMNVAPMAFEYLSPSWKTCDTSMPRAPSSGSAAVRAAVAGLSTMQRSAHSSTLKSTPSCGAHVVVAVLVGAHDPAAASSCEAARPAMTRCGLGQADRARWSPWAGRRPRCSSSVEQREAAGHALGLQLVELVVAGDEHAPPGRPRRPCPTAPSRWQDSGMSRNAASSAMVCNARRGDLLHGRHVVDGRARQAVARLGVGRTAAAATVARARPRPHRRAP